MAKKLGWLKWVVGGGAVLVFTFIVMKHMAKK